jgi:hypothetical protein
MRYPFSPSRSHRGLKSHPAAMNEQNKSPGERRSSVEGEPCCAGHSDGRVEKRFIGGLNGLPIQQSALEQKSWLH